MIEFKVNDYISLRLEDEKTPKSLRRWFNTHLQRNSIKTSIIRRLMGHKGDIGDEHYNQIFEQAKEGEYEELALFFSENIDILVSLGNGNKRYTKIDKKVEKLEQRNKDLIEQLDETNKKVDKLEEIALKIPNLLEAYENMKKLLSENLSNISDKEIIKTLGLKEIPEKSDKKLKLK